MYQKKDKKFFKKILAIVGACAVSVLAFALPFIFKPKIDAKNMLASADSVDSNVVFDGSNLAVYYSVFSGRSPLLSGSTLTYYAGMVSITNITTSTFNFAITEGFNNTNLFNVTRDFSTVVRFSTHWSPGSSVVWAMVHCSYGVDGFYCPLMYNVGTDFDANIKGVNISQVVCSSGQISDNDVGASTRTLSVIVIRYFGSDADGNLDTSNFIEFAFLNNNFYNSQSRFQNRTYYFTQVDSDSAAYGEGYNAGQSFGYTNGQSVGYKQGYSAGDTQGYNRGYTAGANSTNNYTFTKLIGAVVDVPVQTFINLFNFDLLGINLAGFFTGLLTVAFIITIVKILI